jgi:rSAM/selenodomain-associated transferase 2
MAHQKEDANHVSLPSSIAVIIPAFNESAKIGSTLAAIGRSSSSEIIVVDGGSVDNTQEIAASSGARVLSSPKGRARQMNAGANVARSDILLFLHADTLLPTGFEKPVRRAMVRPGVAAGAFRLRFDRRPSFLLRAVEHTANCRAVYLQMPFGDQAIFLRRELFREVGGFADTPIMEDVELMRRLRGKGNVVIVPDFVVTSARRYDRSGTLRRVLVNKVSILGYYLGVSPWRILRWYDSPGRFRSWGDKADCNE